MKKPLKRLILAFFEWKAVKDKRRYNFPLKLNLLYEEVDGPADFSSSYK